MPETQQIVPDWVVPPNIKAIVTTRVGGVSQPPFGSFNLASHVGDSGLAIVENRRLLQAMFPKTLGWQWLNQVHGAAVADIREPGEPLTVDGLITRTEHVACCVLTADCLPVFLASNRGDEVAIAHAGWRGIAAGVIENTVHRMRSSIAELVAWLGPAIGSCHFEVGEEVRAQVIDSEEGPLANCFVATGNEKKYMADLSRIAMVKLQKLGITNIYVDNTCTYCDADRFFSFRRDGKTGRMACLIYIDGPVL